MKIKADTAPLVLYKIIDCDTIESLTGFLAKRNLEWEFVKQSPKINTIKIQYRGHNLFHDFEIV